MAIFKLLNKYFLKSIVGPLCAFGLPLFFALMFYAMGQKQFAISLPVIVSIGVLAVTLMIIPTLIIDLRKSLILKRIGTSRITTHHFIFILVVYFYFWILLSIGFSFILFAIIAPLAANEPAANSWKNHDIGSTIYSALILGTMGIVVSVFIGTFCKNSMIASALAFILIFFSLFTSGLLMPFSIIRQIGAMQVLNYFLPFNWPMLMMQEAWGVMGFNLLENGMIGTDLIVVSNNVWNIMIPLKINILKFGEVGFYKDFEVISSLAKIWNIVSPFVFTTGLVFGIAFAFKWTER